ncbi:hypothetical protein QJS10_CPB15g00129 [Acorus calamus]|uniref:Uncharacterized protein n=1 Tax=Acorus calamus TaxID=4465 RepID=A0AAV9D6U5_ACOCL|nr:hypothetical protein QJS10_CPB15g00129 [Acorus calamus]
MVRACTPVNNFAVIEGLWVNMWSAGNSKLSNLIHQSVILVAIWSIWKARNDTILKGSLVYVENIWETMVAKFRSFPPSPPSEAASIGTSKVNNGESGLTEMKAKLPCH